MKRFYGHTLLILLLAMTVAVSIPGLRAEDADQDNKLNIAIVDFRDITGKHLEDIGEASTEILGTLLSQTDQFNVLERDKLEAIITEQGLTMSGLIDSDKNAVQVGKLLGANYIITGSVVSLTTKNVKFKGYKIETEKIITEMTVNVKIINITTGKIEFASLFPAKEEVLNAAASTESSGTERNLLTTALKSAVTELVKKIDAKNIKNPQKIVVKFDSDPKGADLEIDGVFYGNTPTAVPLNPGLHEVIISLAGYESWTKKINAMEGLNIKATLAKKDKSTTTVISDEEK
jgi:curli biogenesis system outer membrane secretion channel CsgG